MNGKMKAAAVVLAAAVSCAALAGCDSLVTTDVSKDYLQVIAEVDITRSADFAEGGKYAAYAAVVGKDDILKRDMVSSFISTGASAMQYNNWTYSDTFNMICESLVNRQVYVQYAKVYLTANVPEYTVEGYLAAVGGDFSSDAARDAAGYAYFLTPAEKAKADYDLRKLINDSIDELERSIIEEEDGDDASSETVRTLPTGAETEDEDYYDVNYKIFTGTETAYGSYERVDGSTATTRRKAYTQFLANLRGNDLLEEGENVRDFESMNYYAIEKRSAYESALMEKLNDMFEEEQAGKLTEEWANGVFEERLAAQKDSYRVSGFDDTLSGMSDTSFVLAAPAAEYGFVINILLPFDSAQTQELENASNDYGDPKGGKFAAREALLKKVRGTDQRGTWFTGSEDYSFEAEEGGDAYRGSDPERNYLFFGKSFEKVAEGEQARYKKIKNYLGNYTYNGKVTVTGTKKSGKNEYKLVPAEVDIDGFLTEMKGYLSANGYEVTTEQAADPTGYYTHTNDDFYTKDPNGLTVVNYDTFIYEKGKVSAFTEKGSYNANEIFLAGSDENNVFSIINELSFAYNTDTAGLNPYLGYAVSPYKTSYMAEFEHAAQWAVANGAGSYCVVPTDYGWHVLYCTFSFVDVAEGAESPFSFDYSLREEEGTFSNIFFEYLKSKAVSTYATNKRTSAINEYVDDCSTVHEDRFADLLALDLQ